MSSRMRPGAENYWQATHEHEADANWGISQRRSFETRFWDPQRRENIFRHNIGYFTIEMLATVAGRELKYLGDVECVALALVIEGLGKESWQLCYSIDAGGVLLTLSDLCTSMRWLILENRSRHDGPSCPRQSVRQLPKWLNEQKFSRPGL